MQNTSRKGDIESKADSHKNPNNNPQPNAVLLRYGDIGESIKPQAEAIQKLDSLLVECEGRSTIYYIALGLVAKQARAKLKVAQPDKPPGELLDGFITDLKLSAGRSARSVQRYVELVDKMTDFGMLSGVLSDALKAANFSEEIKSEVSKVTGGLGFTDLCTRFGMLRKKKTGNQNSGASRDRLGGKAKRVIELLAEIQNDINDSAGDETESDGLLKIINDLQAKFDEFRISTLNCVTTTLIRTPINPVALAGNDPIKALATA